MDGIILNRFFSFMVLDFISYIPPPSMLILKVQCTPAMARLLESGGRLLIYVWAKDQKKEEMSSYLKQNKKNFKRGESGEKKKQEKGEFGLPVHINRTVFEHQVPFVHQKFFNKKFRIVRIRKARLTINQTTFPSSLIIK